MLSIVKSCALIGIKGYIVYVETDSSNALPSFDVVGLPDVAVRESRDRVKSAIKNSLFDFPPKKYVVNLAPADIKKAGPYYDLPIAIGILGATGQIDKTLLHEYIFIGELSLEGKLKPVKGILPMVISLRKSNFQNIILPIQNAEEASVIKDINIYPVDSLVQAVGFINGTEIIKRYERGINVVEPTDIKSLIDMSEVKGQDCAKRALEVSAAGGHNVAMVGPPGTGKTMLARRIPTILPDMTLEESIEVTMIHSVAGYINEENSLINIRPFRAPHHSISLASLVGGGKVPMPGEISLAHLGVLFLDELTEFRRDVLESMRQPLEDGEVTISRVSATVSYPSNFMFVSSFNPCPCGYYGYEIKGKECKCTPHQVANYLGKITGPLFDRIDMHIELFPVVYSELENRTDSESSESIRERVNLARDIQVERYKKYGIFYNSQLTPALIKQFCKLDNEGNSILRLAFDRLGLSARAYNKILKVARTIADLDSCNNIYKEHLTEAIQYRGLDRKLRSY